MEANTYHYRNEGKNEGKKERKKERKSKPLEKKPAGQKVKPPPPASNPPKKGKREKKKGREKRKPNSPIPVATPPVPPFIPTQFRTTTNPATATSSQLALASCAPGARLGSTTHVPSELMVRCGRAMSKSRPGVSRRPKLRRVRLMPMRRMASWQEGRVRVSPRTGLQM